MTTINEEMFEKKKIANVHNLVSVLVSKMDVVYAIKK